MCLSPSGDKLYVVDSLGKIVFVYNTDTLSFIGGVSVGNKPAAIFVEPGGKKAYVANYEDRSVTIIDAVTLNLIITVEMNAEDESNQGKPFAFASSESGAYVYVACKRDNARDYVLVININDNSVFPLAPESVEPEPEFDLTHNQRSG